MFKSAIVALCIATSMSWVVPAQAFPVASAPAAAQSVDQSKIVNVDWNGHRGGNVWRHRGGYQGYNGGYRGFRGGYRGDRGYYRGDRGYYRGYRHHGGNAGAIIGGLAAGAIIGGALASRPHYGSHSSSCAARYRSYRASDNTYQPNSGPRRQCR